MKSFSDFIEYLYSNNIDNLKNNQNEGFEIEHVLELFSLAHQYKVGKYILALLDGQTPFTL
jgi:hypothetical protein